MIPVAILLQVIGSFLFAGGAILQSLGVRSTFDHGGHASDNRLSLAGLFRLFLIPRWALGLLCVLIGAAINFTALTLAPVAVVQPVGILAVSWSVILSSWVHKHRIPPNVWVAVVITLVGLVGFTLISSTHATGNQEARTVPLVITFVVVVSICLGLAALAPRAVPWLKATLWSSIGATLYGMATGMLKATADLIIRYDNPLLDPQVILTVAMMLTGFVGGAWMIQQGYASGPAEITVATMTTVDPFVAVLFGLIVLGEGSQLGLLPGVGMAAMGAVAIYGVVLLSRFHPEAQDEHEARTRASHTPPVHPV
ncbi:DMT family transporter [Tessaracoccus oleiagri]|uniref:Magnesium transporter NIPA n=1 Tax=Tessaracoccus oleiagri TaxID=686624 RepID=A0A1G9LR36_9ACTN|nr:DMT family transporter [Tessaracoccus oleiagri]SDL64416.1 Magnesium transporter NIPA [Tessaracoccus oleiagri]